MDELHAGRLRKLADFLDELEPELFDPAHWWYDNGCRTAACAGGWATTIREFQEDGFLLRAGTPCFQGYPGVAACVRFFGLGDAQAGVIFLPTNYVTGAKTPPAVVAKRLRAAAEDATWEELRAIE